MNNVAQTINVARIIKVAQMVKIAQTIKVVKMVKIEMTQRIKTSQMNKVIRKISENTIRNENIIPCFFSPLIFSRNKMMKMLSNVGVQSLASKNLTS